MAIILFFPVAAGVFAQDETVSLADAPASDPITAKERELFLGGGAADNATAPPAASTLSILRVLLTLAVVAAAIYGIVFFIKRVSRGRTTQDPFLKILASTSLGTNRGVHIISFGSQAWLVGSAENRVNLISEIDDKDALNELFLADSRKNALAPETGADAAGRFPNFRALLHRLGMPAESGAPPTPESIRKRGERLKGL